MSLETYLLEKMLHVFLVLLLLFWFWFYYHIYPSVIGNVWIFWIKKKGKVRLCHPHHRIGGPHLDRMCVYTCVSMSTCVYLCVYVSICVCLCVYGSIHVCLCLCACACVSECVYLCVHLQLCVLMHVSVCVSVYQCVSLYVCMAISSVSVSVCGLARCRHTSLPSWAFFLQHLSSPFLNLKLLCFW